MRRLGILLALGLAASASAAVLTTRRAVLATAQAVGGGSTDQVEAGTTWTSLYICGVETGDTTWAIEQSLDAGVSWAVVRIGTTAMSYANLNACAWIPAPAGRYRTNITTCGVACNLTATALAGPEG